MTHPDDLLEQLARLPRADMAASTTAELRERALARFTGRAAQRIGVSRSNAWLRWFETSLVAAFIASYTWWTVGELALLRDAQLGRAEHFANFEAAQRTRP